MSNRNAPTPPSTRTLRLPAVVGWFSTWAGLGGILGFHVAVDLGWRDDLPPYIVASLVVGGGIAGWILYKPVRSAVAQRRWIRAALLGIAAALMALELGVTLVILALPGDGTVPPLTMGWLFAPLFALPVLFTAGPLSGAGLVLVARIYNGPDSQERP